MSDNPRPTDFLQKFADKDFANTSSVDVAEVPANADPKDLLFPPEPPASGGEEEGDVFFFSEEPKVVEKYGQGMWYTDVEGVGGKVHRYYGKTRTEVAKALVNAQKHASLAIDELKKKKTENPTPTQPEQHLAPTHLVPDTKLPYDPIRMEQPRPLSEQEVIAITELQQTNPVEAYRRLYKAQHGCYPEEIGQAVMRMDSMFQRRIADEAAFNFQARHVEDWDATPGNSALLHRYMSDRNWPVTDNNLEIAFQDLKRQGKLTMPPPDAPEPTATSPTSELMVEEVAPPPPPVSVPTGSAPSPGRERQPESAREMAARLNDMPLAEMRDTIQSALRAHRRGAR